MVERPNVRGKEEVCRVSLGRAGLLPGAVGDVEGRGGMGTTSMVRFSGFSGSSRIVESG